MRVLVTGGTGVVGQAAVTALVGRGHDVVLLSRHATRDASCWASGVTGARGDVADADSVRGRADGCDAVLHIAGIVREAPPEVTFESVNVRGTRNLIVEARRAGVRRFVYVSSLGADRGDSDYHRSKLAGERAVAEEFGGAWTIVRPGNVYGPGDEVISLLLRMVRVLPVIPVIDGGEQVFQPIWVGDVGEALARVVERDDLAGRALEIAGAERTSVREVLDRLERITDERPARVPLPGFLASLGTRLAESVGATLPVSTSQLVMLEEGNYLHGENALTAVLGLTPTPLDEGLRTLADAQPEQLPDAGVGALVRKRFWAEIEKSVAPPEALLREFRERFAELTPWHVGVGAEPGTATVPREGETLTLSLPLRGTVQVRVAEVTPHRMTLMTLEGHPLAGAVRILCEPRGERVRFEVQVYDRAATIADWLLMNPVGQRLQSRTWTTTVSNVVAASGGQAPDGVQEDTRSLDDDQAARVTAWLRALMQARQRAGTG